MFSTKLFKDPIHNYIELDPVCTIFIDTPQFQRLRHLKQLGLTYYVYPGASHNRFEHSLGVAGLARRYVSRLKQEQPDLGITPRDVLKVQIAGLCHDLGHGVYSHVCEHELAERVLQLEDRPWHHEKMSGHLFDIVCEDSVEKLSDMHDEIRLTSEDFRDIKSMMTGETPPKHSKRFLWDVVANKRTGIDVDKFDYLTRDAHCCGVKVSCDTERLILRSKVHENQIAYKWTEKENVEKLFVDRTTMHKQVYQHRVGKTIELMVTDVLFEMKEVIGLAEKLRVPQEFIKLDDDIIREVYRMSVKPGNEHADSVERAQKILHRLYSRDLYGFCGEVAVDAKLQKADIKKWSLERAICDSVRRDSAGTVKLEHEDVIIRTVMIDSDDPMKNISFFGGYKYSDIEPDQKAYLCRGELRSYQGVRAFHRGGKDSQKENYIQKALKSCIWEHCRMGYVQNITPLKRQRQECLSPSALVPHALMPS